LERPFENRAHAGRLLAARLAEHAGRGDAIVLALPRGGVPVGYEVALALRAPLDVVLVRKLGVPGREELAMGAIASGGVEVLNEDLIEELEIGDAAIEESILREERELERRERAYRGAAPPLDLEGRVAIVVDDGLATGATMRAALASVRRLAPARVVVAVPVGPPEMRYQLTDADEIVCLVVPRRFQAVAFWYDDFEPTSDDEVRDLLERAARRRLPGRVRGGVDEHGHAPR
jgi:putative phosphoribosyl transferase